MNRTWVLHGHKESKNLLISDTLFSINKNRKGSVEIKNLCSRKNGSLSMGNPHFTVEQDNKIMEDDKNQYCVYKLMSFYLKNHLPVGYDGPIFCSKQILENL